MRTQKSAVTSGASDAGGRRSWRARAARAGAGALVAVVALLVIEGACRLLGFGTPDPMDDPARGFLPIGRLFTERTDEHGEVVLTVDGSRTKNVLGSRLQFNEMSVPAKKPPGETRIVCVGGSMTYGWPWDDRVSYPRLLEAGLRAMSPDRSFRVVNLGAPGWGTTRIALIADEIAALDPDVVVVSSGNNEAVEAAFARDVFRLGRGPVEFVHALSRRSYLMNAVRRVVSPPRPPTPEPLIDRPVLVMTDASRAEVVARFEENMRRTAGRLAVHGARVYLSSDPVNERDCPPICRDAPGDEDGRADPALAAEFANARSCLADGRFDAAVAVLESCRRADPRSAQVAFARARALSGAGRLDEGRAEYRAALELDAVALRSFGALRDAAARAASSTRVGVVDFVAATRAAAPDGVPGDDLFLDDCHLNESGSAVAALAVARALAADGVVVADEAAWGRFDEGVRRHLRSVRWSAADEVAALRFLLGYYRLINPTPARAAEIQRRIESLDPGHALADDEYRRALFR